ncbi:MAG: NTP transferase domain-containing protein [Deltaproteobacteria bacterium]|nr:NTP transferase domain-containing protein [Deltaproteobacteria bacterium]
MKIVIPMAGHSERFQREGFTTPKPFMLIDDRPMIHWVCSMFSEHDDFVFVVQEGHAQNKGFAKILQTAAPRYHIVTIKPHRLGPLHTTLAADGVIDNTEPVIIAYSDFYQHWKYHQFLMCVADYDGGISVLKGFHPVSFGKTCFGHLRCNTKGEMLEIKEKGSFTDRRHEEPASSGVYYIKSWSLYKRLVSEMIASRNTIGGEYYISQIFNTMVSDGLRVVSFEVDRFICWGTPEDVAMYRFWSEYFKTDTQAILST